MNVSSGNRELCAVLGIIATKLDGSSARAGVIRDGADRHLARRVADKQHARRAMQRIVYGRSIVVDRATLHLEGCAARNRNVAAFFVVSQIVFANLTALHNELGIRPVNKNSAIVGVLEARVAIEHKRTRRFNHRI